MVRSAKRIAIIVTALLVAFAVYYPYSPAARQAAGLRRLDTFVRSVKPSIEADPRLAKVRVGISTAVVIAVTGEVESVDAVYALRDILAKASGGTQPMPRILLKLHGPDRSRGFTANGWLDDGITIEAIADAEAPVTTAPTTTLVPGRQ